MVLEHDHETFNEADLKKVGLDLYMKNPSAEHLMTSWRVYNDADEPPPFKLWDRADTDEMPPELGEALVDPHVEKWAFNAAFERRAAIDILDLDSPYEGWRCAMYLAYMHSFSGGLDMVGSQMFLPEEETKKKDGKALIDLFCKPQKITKANPYRRRNWDTNPNEWDVFREYCIFDSISEYGIKKRLIKFPIGPDEWRLYEMDQAINDRGLPIDREFVESAILLSDQRKREIISLMSDLTGLDNPNSPTQLMGWLKDRGYAFDDLQKDTIKKVLAENKIEIQNYRVRNDLPLEDKDYDKNDDLLYTGGFLDASAVRGLKYRQQSARLSVRKYTAIKNRLADDDHIRHVFQIGGASRTIRWAGRGFQPQNLTSTPKDLEPKGDDASLLAIVTDTIREGNLSAMHLMCDEPMDYLAGCVRSSVRAPDDMELVCCDLSSIESVVIGWLCGCERLLNVFRDGRDAYKDFATEFYGIPYEDVTSEQRKICKPPTLGCGFGLGGGDLRDGKRTGLWGYAEKMGVDMTRETSHSAVRLWRDTYEEIVHYWYAIERTVISVVEDGRTRTCGPITVKLMKPYLVMFLPDGAPRYYYKPKIWHEEKIGRTGRPYTKKNFTHMGKEQKTGRWIRMSSRGAKLVENLVQSIARQILKAGLMRAFDDGWDLRGHVHDELISLRPANSNYYTVERLIECMIEANDNYPGLPLNAAGWAGVFYRK